MTDVPPEFPCAWGDCHRLATHRAIKQPQRWELLVCSVHLRELIELEDRRAESPGGDK